MKTFLSVFTFVVASQKFLELFCFQLIRFQFLKEIAIVYMPEWRNRHVGTYCTGETWTMIFLKKLLSVEIVLEWKWALKGQCQLQCIARSNNAWRPFYWRSNSCFGFQSVIYFNHPMVILAHFNRIVTTKHQRNVYNRYLLTFHHFQGKM